MQLNLPDYTELLTDLKKRIRASQYEALRAVNASLVSLYWDIGKQITEKQAEQAWGKSVVEKLAADLQAEFVGMQGFSARNLWLMKQFYEHYNQNPILQPMVAELGWAHNVVIMGKCKNDFQREFYMLMTKKFGWTKNVLIHQIEAHTYEKHLESQTNFDQTLTPEQAQNAILAIKDEYQFDFLELTPQHSEYELEQMLIKNIRAFLLEMGGYFSFIGNQYRVEVGGQEYYIDLLLYHRLLKCLVVIDLKVGVFTPEMAGKMQFYLNIVNHKVRLADENPAIGIIICKSKNKTVVEYALQTANQPIGVATYTIDTELPEKWKHLLPSAELLEKHLLVLSTLKNTNNS